MATIPTGQSGVRKLISRLREEGVKAGEDEAGRILQEAKDQAALIVSQAREEATQIRADTRAAIQAEQNAAREAIRLAFRDTEIKIKSELKAAFAERVRRLVTMELKDNEFLRQLILTICGLVGSKIPPDQGLEVLVADELFLSEGEEILTTERGERRMGHFILGVSSEMLREGIELKPSGNNASGISVKLVGKDIDIDLGDKALTNMLLKYLIPRYRAIVEGVDDSR